MFTGIVEEIGIVKAFYRDGRGARLTISGSVVLDGTSVGDSINVNGVCLTVTEKRAAEFTVDVMGETLRMSNLEDIQGGDRVNLERALQMSGRLGGHLVTGHVDAIGRIREKRQEGNSWRIFIEPPKNVLRYIMRKGSIAVDGISLTVADVDYSSFQVAVIPHTLAATTLGTKNAGQRVNLESDIIAKYVERLLGGGSEEGLSLDVLRKKGFA
ncbi:MAG: riboflavin synthase [Nitrospirota bacterium]